MPNIIIADKSYQLSELAAATANADTDIFYVVKIVDGEEVAYKITRAQLLSGLGSTLAIENNGTSVGNASTLNFVPGTNITFSITDAGSGQINVEIAASGSVAVAWGNITGTLADQTDLQAALDSLQGGIDSNSSDISTNAGNIATNTGDIATNAAGIAANAGDISTNAAAIATKYDASNPDGFITEPDVIDTARQYTKGQGMTNVALTISTGTTAIDFTDGNSFTLTLTADTELQLPTNDRPFSCQVWVVQDGTGGWALTFVAGYVVLGDTLTTTAGDKALLNIASDGTGNLVIIINNLQ